MSTPRKSARRQPRKPPKLSHDLDRPEADPEEVFEVQSISDDSSVSITERPAMPSRTKPAAAASRTSSRSKAAKQAPSYDVIEISTDGSVGQQDDGHDDMDLSDFEDVDVADTSKFAAASPDEEEDLDMEDVDLDQDQSAQDLQDMYAAAYRDIQAKYGDGTAEDDGEGADDADDAGNDASSSKPIPIFKDGKGQHRGVEISMGSRSTKQADTPKQKSNNFLTPRDRQNRITAHKLLVLSMLAHARVRNKWCNDEDLRDTLADSVPDYLVTKLRSIHPKKVTEQRERIRMFESFLSDLVRWWSQHFRLDPTMVADSALRQPDQDIATGVIPGAGRRIDGWIVETAVEREQRYRRERREQQRYKEAKERQAKSAAETSGRSKGKGKATETAQNGSSSSLKPPTKAMEITIFAPGSAIRPIYLRLLPAAEQISSPAGLKQRAHERSGSRETSAQLFCALCRAMGIPARLVVSPQPLSWSVGASKLANTAQPGSQADKKPNQLRARNKGSSSRRFASKPVHEFTSDEDGDYSASGASSTARSKRSQRAISVDSLSSAEEATASDGSQSKQNGTARSRAAARDTEDLTKKAVLTAKANSKASSRRKRNQPITVDETASDASSTRNNANGRTRNGKQATASPSSCAKGKAKQTEPIDVDETARKDGESEDEDYRPGKWKNLKAPLKVEHKVKLRSFRPKQLKDSEIAGEDTTADPVDLQAPPTMWVEVFSKPYQRWITVDPVRCLVRPSGNRHMEPPAFDRQNKLIYVVAIEEDGYARDVTARYTKTLNSRVSRLRPPTRAKGEEEWWSKVARAIHRPQKLDRDAMEDAELQDNSSREPMPSSMNGFKDHPIYFLEKFLKRDEVVFPRRQIATFQGSPVFSKSDVQTLRSSRQWYNEGRVVKDGEVALKFVKARGYTLANKRAEEQARLEGREVAQEGLYAEFQTKLYEPPPVGPDGTIPTNGFGNIDLFVPSMLPAGAVHLPFSGVAKVAKKLGVPYAEAITGFEFRKQRGMPKIVGIVVAQQNAELVEEAFWQQEQQDALKQQTKKMERAMKNWRKLINAVRIAKRVKEQYGDKVSSSSKKNDAKASSSGSRKKAVQGQDGEEQPEKSRFFAAKEDTDSQEDPSNAATTEDGVVAEDLDIDMEPKEASEVAADSSPSTAPSTPGKRKIISLAQLASNSADANEDESDSSASTTPATPPPAAKRQRRSQKVEPQEPVSAKRPRRAAAAAKPKMEVAETETPQRRSSRRSGRQQYTEPATDDEVEPEEEVEPKAEPEAEVEDGVEEEATLRRTSRRITVKLSARKK